MIKSKNICLFFIALFYLFMHSTLSANFEERGIGARPIGRGKSFVALCDDVYSIYYNPAGLSQIKTAEVSTSYGKLFWGLDDNSNLINSLVLYAHPIITDNNKKSWGTIGIGWLNFSLNNLYKEDMFIISYGKNLYKDFLSGGINLKWLSKKFGNDIYTAIDPIFNDGSSASNFSLDLSGLYNLNKTFSFGITVSDVNQPDLGLKETDKVPCGVKIGSIYKYNDYFNAGMDIYYSNEDIRLYSGAEKWLIGKTLGIRGGIGFGSRLYRNLACGISWLYSNFQIDYAFVYPFSGIEEIYGSHQISLSMQFGKQETETEETTITLSEEEEEKITPYIQAGIELYNRGQILESLDSFKNALAIYPKHQIARQYIKNIEKTVATKITGLHKKALSYYKNEEWEKAEECWKNVLALNPSEPKAKTFIEKINQKLNNYYSRGQKLYQEGQYTTAFKEWRKVVKIYPGYSKVNEEIDTNINQALLKIKAEKTEKIKMINTLIAEGLSYYNKRAYSLAAEKWNQVFSLDRENKEASKYIQQLNDRLFEDGMNLYKNNQFTLALETWNELLQISPDYTKAKTYIEQVKNEFIEKSKTIYEDGVKEYNAGNYLAAITSWENALRITPENETIKQTCVEAYISQGIMYYRNNLLENAIEIWNKVLILQPKHSNALKYLKRATIKMENLKSLKK